MEIFEGNHERNRYNKYLMKVNLKRNIIISSNATCERAFSKMAVIKTELRNRLTDSHRSDIILTTKLAPD